MSQSPYTVLVTKGVAGLPAACIGCGTVANAEMVFTAIANELDIPVSKDDIDIGYIEEEYIAELAFDLGD